jgi:hypothetical protein
VSDKTDLAVIPTPGGSLSAALARAAADPTIDPQRMRELHAIHREIVADEAKAAFNEALRALQAEMPRVKKNGTVNLVRDGKDLGAYRFATWEDIDAIVRPLLEKHGFAVTFSEAASDANGIRWAATWRHNAGHSEQNFITLPPDSGHGRNPLQARGSTSSYAKRYLAEDFCNIVREAADDDGKRGGTVYISPEQCDIIRGLLKDADRQEGPFLDRLFAGVVRSVEEIEDGTSYMAAKSTLEGLKAQQAAKKAKGNA